MIYGLYARLITAGLAGTQVNRASEDWGKPLGGTNLQLAGHGDGCKTAQKRPTLGL